MQQEKKDRSVIIGLSISGGILVFGIIILTVLSLIVYWGNTEEAVVKMPEIKSSSYDEGTYNKGRPYFIYEEQEGLEIYSLSIVGAFNNWDREADLCEKDEDGYWFTEIDLPPGEHMYKFCINEDLIVNDPWADKYILDEKGKVVSVIIVNKEGQRVDEIGMQYDIFVEDYGVQSFEQEKGPFENRKVFNIHKDKQVVHSLACSDIVGLNGVVIVWYTPDGRLYDLAEEALDGESENIGYFLYYNLPIDTKTMLGKWKVHIFTNGYLLLEEYFTITDGSTIDMQDITEEGEEVL